MTGPSDPATGEAQNASPAGGNADPAPTGGFWAQLKRHKVAEWTLAYAAAAYTLLHVVEMISEAMDWPHLVARILTVALGLGFPIVVTLAWYHGAKALRRVSAPELVIITLLLVLAGSVLWLFNRKSGEPARASPDATAAGAHGSVVGALTPAAPRTSIAVMPFANLTGDPSKDYLGDGMAEEVIDTLTKVPGLQVPARTSSFAYKGRNVDIRQIGRDLNVGVVLEGSVRSAGKRIRITAQLINAQTGLHIWSQTYEQVFTDLFRLQDDLAAAIVRQLQVNLNGASPSSVAQAPPTRDVQAYDLYMQGFSLMLRGSDQNLHLALDLFQQALERDPTFARALAARSRARLTFLVRGYTLPNALDDADRDARRALALDPSLGVAHQALANVSALRANWLQADASYRAAISADDSNPDVHSGYAMVVLAAAGYLQQAYEQGRKSYQLAPASPNHIGIMSNLSVFTHRDADAVRLADLAVALGDSPNLRAQVYVLADLHRGLYSEAAERDIAMLPPEVRDAGGTETKRLVYAALSDPAKRRAAVQALQSLIGRLGGASHLRSASRRDFITDFAMLDAVDSAYELATLYLDDFLRTGTGGGAAWTFLWLPEMRPFRLDPRFAEFVRRMSLPRYWKVHGAPDECELSGETLTCR